MGDSHPEEAVAGLRAEHANLVAAADHASAHGWWGHDDELRELLERAVRAQ